jgi:hypothetical protein
LRPLMNGAPPQVREHDDRWVHVTILVTAAVLRR